MHFVPVCHFILQKLVYCMPSLFPIFRREGRKKVTPQKVPPARKKRAQEYDGVQDGPSSAKKKVILKRPTVMENSMACKNDD